MPFRNINCDSIMIYHSDRKVGSNALPEPITMEEIKRDQDLVSMKDAKILALTGSNKPCILCKGPTSQIQPHEHNMYLVV